MKRRRRNKKRRINLILILMLFFLVVFLTPRFVAFAKYVYSSIQEYYLASKDFYFSSDKLSLGGTEYKVTNNWSGLSTYVVAVNMTSKRNDKAFTEADIAYNVSFTCSDNITCTLSKASGTIAGTGSNGVNEDSFEVRINPAAGRTLINGEEAWVQVTATSTSPYSQTITGKLIVEVGTADVFYEIVDSVNSPYLTVTITNGTSDPAAVTLSYNPANVLLDMTSRFYLNSSSHTTQQINGYAYINSITKTVDALGITTVKFYKTDPSQNYSYLKGESATPIISLTYQ